MSLCFWAAFSSYWFYELGSIGGISSKVGKLLYFWALDLSKCNIWTSWRANGESGIFPQEDLSPFAVPPSQLVTSCLYGLALCFSTWWVIVATFPYQDRKNCIVCPYGYTVAHKEVFHNLSKQALLMDIWLDAKFWYYQKKKKKASVNNLVQMPFCISVRNSVAKFLDSGIAGLKGQLHFSTLIPIDIASLPLRGL